MRASKNTTTQFTIAIMIVTIPLTIVSKSAPIPSKIYTVLDKVIMFGSTDSIQETTTPILLFDLDI